MSDRDEALERAHDFFTDNDDRCGVCEGLLDPDDHDLHEEMETSFAHALRAYAAHELRQAADAAGHGAVEWNHGGSGPAFLRARADELEERP